MARKKDVTDWYENRGKLSPIQVATEYDHDTQTLFLWDAVSDLENKLRDALGCYGLERKDIGFGQNVWTDLMMLDSRIRTIDHKLDLIIKHLDVKEPCKSCGSLPSEQT